MIDKKIILSVLSLLSISMMHASDQEVMSLNQLVGLDDEEEGGQTQHLFSGQTSFSASSIDIDGRDNRSQSNVSSTHSGSDTQNGQDQGNHQALMATLGAFPDLTHSAQELQHLKEELKAVQQALRCVREKAAKYRTQRNEGRLLLQRALGSTAGSKGDKSYVPNLNSLRSGKTPRKRRLGLPLPTKGSVGKMAQTPAAFKVHEDDESEGE